MANGMSRECHLVQSVPEKALCMLIALMSLFHDMRR